MVTHILENAEGRPVFVDRKMYEYQEGNMKIPGHGM